MRGVTRVSAGLVFLFTAGCGSSDSGGAGTSAGAGSGGFGTGGSMAGTGGGTGGTGTGGGISVGGSGNYSGSGGSGGGLSMGGSSSGGSGGGSSGSSGSSSGTAGPGQLTAGDWDDNLNFDFYQEYLTSTVIPVGEQLPTADRVVIHVKNAAGLPVSNAVVTIKQNGQTLLQAPTASDGRLLYFPSHDGEVAASGSSVTVKAPGMSTAATFATPVGDEWELGLPGSSPAKPTGIDVAFVVDATGSMGDELSYLTAEIDDIASAVSSHYPNASLRWALIVYRDSGDEYVTKKFDFTSSLASFHANLAAQVSGGGGDYEEAMDLALKDMHTLSWSTGNVARVGFLIADAPPHPGAGKTVLTQADIARHAGIKLYPVAASGTDDRTELLMRQSAEWTLGRYLFVTDDSGIGGAHAEPHIPCYEVTHLNNLLKRVLYTELEGKYFPAEPADVVRTEGEPVNGVCTNEAAEQYFIY